VTPLREFVRLVGPEEWPSVAKCLEFWGLIEWEKIGNKRRVVSRYKNRHVKFNLHCITFYILFGKFDIVDVKLSEKKRVCVVQATDSNFEFFILKDL